MAEAVGDTYKLRIEMTELVYKQTFLVQSLLRELAHEIIEENDSRTVEGTLGRHLAQAVGDTN